MTHTERWLLQKILTLEKRLAGVGGGTPSAHASSHEDGGSDEIDLGGLSGTPAALTTHASDPDAHKGQKNSIELDAGDLQLVGDEASPGNNQVYGTDGSGNKGWKADPSGGSGDSTHTAAYGSRPSSSNDGDLFLPNDGFQLERDTGSVWVPWGPLFPFTAPISGDFAWINQGSSSVSTTKGGIFLSVAVSSGIVLRKKAAPSTPYTITIAFLPLAYNVNFQTMGVAFRQSSDGKLHTFTLEHSSTAINLVSQKWNSATSFNANYTSSVYLRSGLIFMRIADNGTNRICSYSGDGQNWISFHSIGRTDFLTADEVGFFGSESGGVRAMGMTLLHWAEG